MMDTLEDATRPMSNKDADSVRLMREEYLPFVEFKLLPAVCAANPGPYLTAVLSFFLLKAERHLKAVCELCEAGLGEDALIIARAIYEHRVHLAWISQPTTTRAREHRAKTFAYDGDRQRLTKARELRKFRQAGKCVEWIDDLFDAQPNGPKIRKPRGFKSLPSLKAMAEAIGGGLECEYHCAYWSLSKLAHPSGLGSSTYVYAKPEGDVQHEAIAIAIPNHLSLAIDALHVARLEELAPELETIGRRFLEIQRET